MKITQRPKYNYIHKTWLLQRAEQLIRKEVSRTKKGHLISNSEGSRVLGKLMPDEDNMAEDHRGKNVEM